MCSAYGISHSLISQYTFPSPYGRMLTYMHSTLQVQDLREKLSTYFGSKPTSTAPERTFTSSLFPSSYSSPYSPYSSPYSSSYSSSFSPYSSSLSTSYSTLTSSTDTKLPGLEPFLTSSFPSTYSNGSGLMLGVTKHRPLRNLHSCHMTLYLVT